MTEESEPEDADESPLTSKQSKSVDEWLEELCKHPAFMTQLPEGQEVPDTIAALQAMKYDDDDDTPEMKAETYKSDGNRFFQFEKYCNAIDSYTEGLRLDFDNRYLRAILYANRAACHFRLENFRSAAFDCINALKLDRSHKKAFSRGIDCFRELHWYDLALDWINKGESRVDIKGDEVEDMRKSLIIEKKLHDKNVRKEKIKQERRRKARIELLEALKARNVKFQPEQPWDVDEFDWDAMEVEYAKLKASARCKLKLNLNDQMIYPTVFLYPEFEQFDFIEEFNENDRIKEHLEIMFEEIRPRWDTENHYRLPELRVYFVNKNDAKNLVQVEPDTQLKAIVADPRYAFTNGCCSLMILSNASQASDDFLWDYKLSRF